MKATSLQHNTLRYYINLPVYKKQKIKINKMDNAVVYKNSNNVIIIILL